MFLLEGWREKLLKVLFLWFATLLDILNALLQSVKLQFFLQKMSLAKNWNVNRIILGTTETKWDLLVKKLKDKNCEAKPLRHRNTCKSLAVGGGLINPLVELLTLPFLEVSDLPSLQNGKDGGGWSTPPTQEVGPHPTQHFHQLYGDVGWGNFPNF